MSAPDGSTTEAVVAVVLVWGVGVRGGAEATLSPGEGLEIMEDPGMFWRQREGL